jgi:hypothetical protein
MVSLSIGDSSLSYFGLKAHAPHHIAFRVTLPGTGHTAADNSGKPELVAAQLRAFFS